MNLAQDLRFAFRTLRLNRGFAITAILALAIGIGANSAMFSVVDGILLRPLPYPASGRLVNLWETNLKRNIPRLVVAAANYFDWRAQNQVFSSMGVYQQRTFNLAAQNNEPERFVGAICDAGFFATLGVSPLLGRTFTKDEETPGRDAVVVLGFDLWRQRFGADPKILGQKLVFDGSPRTVVGVMPESFVQPPLATLWAPLGLDNAARARRDLHTLRVIARLKDNASLAQARSAMETLATRLARQYPDLNEDESIAVNPMLDDTVGAVRPALLVLLGAVVFVLLIACANVANLLLAKAAGRQREIAIRVSMGAQRSRIVSQLLTESVLLALAGGLAGLLIAWGAFRGLLALAPANVPRLNLAALDWRTIAFTFAISLLTGVLFGIVPAWHAARTDVNSLLKEGSSPAGSRSAVRGVFVVAQVAAALILLTGAGLLILSFYAITSVNAGFNPQNLMTMRLAPAPFKYRDRNELQTQLARDILARVSTLPGVQSAAISTDVPLLGNPIFIMRFEGRPPVTPSQAPIANYFAVTPGFFDTMGMRILQGRAIAARDAERTPLVAVVNQTLAQRYFPHENPIGKRLEIGFSTPPEWREIVGVVADVRSAGLDQDTPVQVYTSYFQLPSMIGGTVSAITVLARTAQDPASLGGAMKAAILQADRSQPVYAVQAMTEVVSQSIAQRRLTLVVLGFFAASALLLAALGLYGVMSYTVTQRTSEIGIRMALGAQPSSVLFLIERQGIALVLAGLVVGVAGAAGLSRLMTSLLFGVTSTDPLAFVSAALVLIVISIAACYFPARRAANLEPVIALRHQ